MVGSEEGEEVVVEEFAAMAFRLRLRSVAVDVDALVGKGSCSRRCARALAVASAPRFQQGARAPGAGGDLGRERGFVVGAFVGGAPDVVGAQDTVHRGGAHAREFGGERRAFFPCLGLGMACIRLGHVKSLEFRFHVSSLGAHSIDTEAMRQLSLRCTGL